LKTEEDIKLILSSLKALIGEITPSLRCVSVEEKNKTILWKCVFDSNVTEDDFELLSAAATEVIADYPSPYGIEEIIIVIPCPQPTEPLKHVIYHRHEYNYWKTT
jgi:hypothetical protein